MSPWRKGRRRTPADPATGGPGYAVPAAFGDFFETSMTAAQNGTPAPPADQFERAVAAELLALGAIRLVVGLSYTVGFLMWKQATPGKLALGLVPIAGFLGTVFSLLDASWPVWDDKLQAIHDKVAKTSVVRVR